MKSMVKPFGTSRRALLAGIPATLAAGGIAAGATAALSGPDAQLIRLCAEVADLHQQTEALYVPDLSFEEEELILDARDAAVLALNESQHRLVDRICELTSVTSAGAYAMARCGAACSAMLGEVGDLEDDANNDVQQRLLKALARSFLKGV